MRTTARGFTLIELMIVVAIVAILAMIAYPSYQSYILKSRRIDAHGLLQAAQLAQEKYRLGNTTYAATADFSNAAFTRVCITVGTECRSQEQNYVLTSTGNTGSEFALIATPRGAQARDTACPTITVVQTGTTTTYGPSPACWSR